MIMQSTVRIISLVFLYFKIYWEFSTALKMALLLREGDSTAEARNIQDKYRISCSVREGLKQNKLLMMVTLGI